MYISSGYIVFFLALAVCGLFSAIASAKVNSAYNKYGRIANSSGMTGAEAAQRLMWMNNIENIHLGQVSGNLTDHYDPTKGTVNLSESVYNNPSIAAVAVAAHEMGHVMQNKRGYTFYKIRTALVPIVNIGSFLAMPLVIIGALIDYLALVANPETGFYIAMLGVLLYGGSFLFTLVTLPVELDASKRAGQMLLAAGIIDQSELYGAKKVLSAAALTYVASLLTSLVYFLRFLFMVLSIFGGGRRRR